MGQANKTNSRVIRVANLYPRQMNIYGDTGNALVVRRRAEWRGIRVELCTFNPGDSLTELESCNMVLGGGGQDSGQALVQADLLRIGPTLKELAENGVPMLTVCGTYQLFGNYFETATGTHIEGIGLFKLHTVGGADRMIGNIVTASDTFGELIGYENHSGCTFLEAGATPLAQVVSGKGNNGEDGTEGVRYKNALGTYLHGPLLPKNPRVADFLLSAALEYRYGVGSEESQLAPLPDLWVDAARAAARARPR